MRFASLGSGSRGNALIVEVAATRVMLDCGFTLRETELRLSRLGLDGSMLSGILITHEHDDHYGGVFPLARRHGLTVYATHGTWRALENKVPPEVRRVTIDSHSAFAIGEVEVQPYPVPHDAREPSQFVLGDGVRRLGVLTDAGCATAHMVEVLSRCHGLVLECNHDREMLEKGPYPPRLKQRISSNLGHLENGAASQLLAALDTSLLQHIIAAHLSETNNRPELARAALARALDCDPDWIGIAGQGEGFTWRELSW